MSARKPSSMARPCHSANNSIRALKTLSSALSAIRVRRRRGLLRSACRGRSTPAHRRRPRILPSTTLPPWPAPNSRLRHLSMASRESSPSNSNGNAAPMPNDPIVTATWAKSLPCAASTEAAPSVGPTHGLHTAPSKSPSANWPFKPPVENPPKFESTQLPTGDATSANL